MIYPDFVRSRVAAPGSHRNGTHRMPCILEELSGELDSSFHAGQGLEVTISFVIADAKGLGAGVNLGEEEPWLASRKRARLDPSQGSGRHQLRSAGLGECWNRAGVVKVLYRTQVCSSGPGYGLFDTSSCLPALLGLLLGVTHAGCPLPTRMCVSLGPLLCWTCNQSGISRDCTLCWQMETRECLRALPAH